MRVREAVPVLTGSGHRLALTLLAVLVGCRGQDAPRVLVMNSPQRGFLAPIGLDLPRDSSGAFAFDRWPKACDLLTDADIQAVLPQVTTVVRQPEDQKITLLQDLSVNAIPRPPRTVTAKGARCSYRLELPGVFRKGVTPSLSVNVIYAGTPDAVKLNFSSLGSNEEPVEIPDAECRGSKTSAQVSCRKGPLAFSVASNFFDHTEYKPKSKYNYKDGKWIDRYSVNGRLTMFGATTGAPTRSPGSDLEVQEDNRRNVFRRNALDAELAKTVLAKT